VDFGPFSILLSSFSIQIKGNPVLDAVFSVADSSGWNSGIVFI
jgi:hypothetical protein